VVDGWSNLTGLLTLGKRRGFSQYFENRPRPILWHVLRRAADCLLVLISSF